MSRVAKPLVSKIFTSVHVKAPYIQLLQEKLKEIYLGLCKYWAPALTH